MTPPPASDTDPGRRSQNVDPPGLGEQIGATRDSAKRLIDAHIELAKAEFADIGDEVKRAAIFVGVAIGAAIFAALLVGIGTPLLIGEWLFGSIGWGILQGLLLMMAIAVASVLLTVGMGGGRIGLQFVVAVAVAIAVGLALGLDLSNRGWSALGEAVIPGVDPSWRPLVAAVVTLGGLFGLIGLAAGARAGGAGAAFGGLVGGAVAGAALGGLTAIAMGPRVGAATGVAVGLLAWIALMVAEVARTGIDTDELKKRFWPERTIEVAKETIEWARERMPLSRRS